MVSIYFMSKNVDEYIEKATENINEDRASTKVLLLTLMNYMKQGDDRHREVGMIAAKYLETLQRSNEQLVKLAALMQKKENVDHEITEKDKEDLFDLINQESEDVE